MPAAAKSDLQSRSLGSAALLLIFCATAALAAPPDDGKWEAVFPSEKESAPIRMAVAPIGEGTMAVTVMPGGTDAAGCSLSLAGRPVAMKLAGFDPVSRLAFLPPAEGSGFPARCKWLDRVGPHSDGTLAVSGAAGKSTARMGGWAKRIGGKILPLALLRVTFSGNAPPPGTALVDAEGQIAALLLRERTEDGTCFAIPAEAVLRVFHRITVKRDPRRGWLGLSLKPETELPRIVRVFEKSPAAASGVLPDDVLVSVGDRRVEEYADAVNAFFYLVPGKAVSVKLLRGGKPLEFSLVPTEPQGLAGTGISAQ
jgi:S1-C subfamily serine protease